MFAMTDHPSLPVNRLPLNQLALNWLRSAKEPPDPSCLYLSQLARWGLEQGLGATKPLSPSQPSPETLESQVGALLGAGQEKAGRAFQWLLSNPNLSRQEQESDLEEALSNAGNPLAAARLLLETVYARMAAVSAPIPA
jgi:hypothetical protein